MKPAISILFAAGLSVGAGLWVASARERHVRQPIEFNHKMHIRDVGLECADCHQQSEQLARAGIPNTGRCADCHTDSSGVSRSAAQVAGYVLRAQPIPWRRVNALPKYVYFSHLRHVKLGRLECARCHGPMEDLTTPPQKPHTPLRMEWCLKCHEARGVSNDCLRCHR